MRNLTEDDFDALWPSAPQALVDGILANQEAAWSAGQIDKAIRLAHLMAQVSTESGGVHVVENLNYSATSLTKLWPSRFSPELAADVGRTDDHAANEIGIANTAYSGKNGNTEPNDGYDYRGRGLIQITGRGNYRSLGQACGLDLENNPDQAADPAYCMLIAATFFATRGCLSYADDDDVIAVSAIVNVGHWPCSESQINGLDQRSDWLTKWKQQLGL